MNKSVKKESGDNLALYFPLFLVTSKLEVSKIKQEKLYLALKEHYLALKEHYYAPKH